MAFVKKFNGNTDSTITLGKEGNPKAVEGYFLGSKDVDSDFGPGKLHIFQTKTGTTGVWGKTRLNQLLTDDLRGQMVRASFTGMVAPSKKGRRPSYGFEVEHDPDNTVPVGSINLNTSTAEDEDTSSSSEDYEDSDSQEHETPEPVLERPRAPSRPATVDSARQAKIQSLLNSKK